MANPYTSQLKSFRVTKQIARDNAFETYNDQKRFTEVTNGSVLHRHVTFSYYIFFTQLLCWGRSFSLILEVYPDSGRSSVFRRMRLLPSAALGMTCFSRRLRVFFQVDTGVTPRAPIAIGATLAFITSLSQSKLSAVASPILSLRHTQHFHHAHNNPV